MVETDQGSRASRRDELIQALSCGGPVASARRLQEIQRRQMLIAQRRGRIDNPRPFERAIHKRAASTTRFPRVF